LADPWDLSGVATAFSFPFMLLVTGIECSLCGVLFDLETTMNEPSSGMSGEGLPSLPTARFRRDFVLEDDATDDCRTVVSASFLVFFLGPRDSSVAFRLAVAPRRGAGDEGEMEAEGRIGPAERL